jgi:ribosome maturation protein SDO1
LNIEGEHFEILVNPDAALNLKLGRKIETSQVVQVDEVYSDSSKGLRISSDKLKKYFHTDDVLKIISIILTKGELQLTSEQRKKMVDNNKKQIISIIARNFVDPKTNLPHPPLRLEKAIEEARVSIDPFRSAEEQAKMVIEKLRPILPLKSEKLKLQIKIPAQFASQSIGVIKKFGEIQKDEWGFDGSLTTIVEIPAGIRSSLLEKLGSATKGSVQATVME